MPAQIQTVEEDFDPLLPNNPFVPPIGDVCLINNLPPELLSRIFEVGVTDDDNEDEDDIVEYWDSKLRLSRGTEDNDDKGPQHGDANMVEGDDEETDDSDYDDLDSTGSSDFDPPWPPFQILVSHVCHHWRHIALSTPSLWTTISVTAEDRPPYQYASSMLERSKGLPIDIHVSCEPAEHECDVGSGPSCGALPTKEDLRYLYRLLTPHVHRWRTIEVSVSEYHRMFVFLSAVADSSISAAPQLTTLQLYHHEETEEFDNSGYPTMGKHLILFGGSAPCLTTITLWGVHIDWDQPWIASASRLVELELAFHSENVRPSWAQLSTILRGASSLEKLSLRMSGPSGEPSEWINESTLGGLRDLNAPVELLKVTDFILAFHSQPRAIGLLHKLVLPALKHLVLDFDNGDYTELVDVLAGPATSLSSSSAFAQEQPRSLLNNLESLKLAGLPCRPESVETLYGELQNLTSLNISLSYLDERFIDIFCTSCKLPGRGNTWLPRLVTLYVSGTSAEVLRDVVNAREEAGVPLKSLYVEESCGLDKDDVDWFKKNLKTFELFEGSDDEDVVEFEDSFEDADEWSDMD